jgi:ABC-type polar amino acid transport system ATPase subunit
MKLERILQNVSHDVRTRNDIHISGPGNKSWSQLLDGSKDLGQPQQGAETLNQNDIRLDFDNLRTLSKGVAART